ncbi:gag protein, partial [Lasius niger]
SQQLAAAHITPPGVQAHAPIEIRNDIRCDEPLDAVKCLPEFSGAHESYVSWRQAALAAYRIFRPYDDSSRHYQAVIIIRNKIRGAADVVLASFGTVLNFDAIISRLDFTYSDKRPVHVIEQELATLRQGNMSLLQYYYEVGKKLTLLTNKVNMSYEPVLAKGLCEKFREDALRMFISGLKRSLTDVLISAKPRNLPSGRIEP